MFPQFFSEVTFLWENYSTDIIIIWNNIYDNLNFSDNIYESYSKDQIFFFFFFAR